LRIISGIARGQRIFTPTRGNIVNHIRPTSDKVREAIFNIICDRLSAANVLDLFAGTGALGIEALSRGCNHVVFVDKSSEAVKLINRNLNKCGFSNKATVFRRDLLKSPSFLTKCSPDLGFGLIFADPPYRKAYSTRSLDIIANLDLLNSNGLLVIEEAKDVELPGKEGFLSLADHRKYGDTNVCIYKKESGRGKL